MKRILLLLTLCCAMMSCKKVTIDFSYDPTAPRAGQQVSFTNTCSTGQNFEWNFGDGVTSTLRVPRHVYKKPGTYQITLKVDKKNAWTRIKNITVYDTVPTFTCADSLFMIYEDYTFTANLYNPYNYPVDYLWTVNNKTVGTDESLKTYFTEPNKKTTVGLRVIMNNDTTTIDKTYFIYDQQTNSLLLRTSEGDYRQRIFGERTETAKLDPSAKSLLDAEQDTAQLYNGYEFKLSELKKTFPELEGFHIASRKIYFRAEGLWVAHIDGSDAVQIDPLPCPAMTLDTKDSRIYWANEKGVWYMPFIGSDNNQFVTTPVQLNSMTNILKIAADAELH